MIKKLRELCFIAILAVAAVSVGAVSPALATCGGGGSGGGGNGGGSGGGNGGGSGGGSGADAGGSSDSGSGGADGGDAGQGVDTVVDNAFPGTVAFYVVCGLQRVLSFNADTDRCQSSVRAKYETATVDFFERAGLVENDR